MNLTSKDIIMAVATYLIVGFVGLKQARRFKRPASAIWWILLLAGTVVLGSIFQGTRLISVFGFGIYLNWILQAFPLGLLVGLILREPKRHQLA